MVQKIVGVRLEKDLRKWFEHYLEKYSYGDNFSERFRVFVLRLGELEDQGVIIANPKKRLPEKIMSARH